MIVGIGIDMIEIKRVEKACEKQSFFSRCFTVAEQEMIDGNMSRAAGNWAVKEAVSKVFGTGIVGFNLTDIEVLRWESGKPYVVLYNNAARVSEQLGIHVLHVSISNTQEHAIAYVIGEAKECRV